MLKSKALWTNEKCICLAFPGMWLTPSFWISHYEGMNVLRSYTQKFGKPAIQNLNLIDNLKSDWNSAVHACLCFVYCNDKHRAELLQ